MLVGDTEWTVVYFLQALWTTSRYARATYMRKQSIRPSHWTSHSSDFQSYFGADHLGNKSNARYDSAVLTWGHS